MKTIFLLNEKQRFLSWFETALWSIFLCSLTGILFTFVLKGDLSFGSDEANQFDYAHRWGRADIFGDCCRNWKYLSGLRLWTAWAMDRLTGGWMLAVRLNSVLIALIAAGLWILLLYRRVSKRAALGMALALAIPPVCASFYFTVYDGRMLIILFGGILALGAGRWLKNIVSSVIFGLLVGWGWWEAYFIVFFALPVLVYEFSAYKKNDLTKSLKNLIPVFFGVIAGSSYGYFENLRHAEFIPGYLHWGLANETEILSHLKLFWEVLPQFWNGNIPYGYFQNSVLGLQIDPMESKPYSELLRIWTWVTFTFSFFGFYQLYRNDKEKRSFVCLTLGPAALFFFFFVFGSQVWDALSFRYLSFFILLVPMGFGLSVYYLFRKRKVIAILALAVWIAGYGFILFHRIQRLPDFFPSKIIERGLDQTGINAGYADYWVSEVTRYLSGNRLAIVPYNADPFSCSAYKRAHFESKIGLIILEGLDRPQLIEKAQIEIIKSGYFPVKKWNFEGGWYIVEFHRKVIGEKG